MYCSPNISRLIKSRRMRWAWHVAHMGERRAAHRERDHLEDKGVDESVILRWDFRKWDFRGMNWIDLV